MITPTSTSSSDHVGRPDQLAAAASPASRAIAPRADQISTKHEAFLRAALAIHPEIRADVVTRARALAADPAYPAPQIIQRIAQQIVGSPDLSVDES